MAYSIPTNLTNGTTGLEQIFIYESGQLPAFAPLLLFFIFSIITGAGYYAENRRRGSSNFLGWAAVGGYITSTLSLILFLYVGIVNIATVSICMIISVVFTLAFLLVPRD